MSINNGIVERRRFVRRNCLYVSSVVQEKLANYTMSLAAGEVQRCLFRAVFDVNMNWRLFQKNFNNRVVASARCKMQWSASLFTFGWRVGASLQKNANSGETIEPAVKVKNRYWNRLTCLWKNVYSIFIRRRSLFATQVVSLGCASWNISWSL